MAPPAIAEAGPDTRRVVPMSVMKLSDDAADLPEKFVKSLGERPTIAHNDYCKEIPVISLKGIESESERARIVAEVGYACAEWGIFQIVDHGVPAELMKSMMENTLGFFKLPLDEKVKYATMPGGFPVGYASGSHRADDDILDWRELMVHRCLPKAVRENDISIWPEKPETYRKTLVEYSDTMGDLVTSLLGLISESLGLPTSYIKNAVGGDDAEQKILFNYYPQCPQPDMTLGLRSHTDYGTITVLQQDDVGGLQAYKEDRDKWVTVEPIPGALVINLGDQIQILSNAKYCSVEHQAVVNSNQTRLSLVTFANPSSTSQMGPAPELLSEENPAKYRSYTMKEYLPICFAKKTKKHYDALVI
uniref:Flavonoid synthase I n=1 Tax=Plagiochasma appendiculatum TaxID=157224 RepID=A0A5J6BXR6_9MARC|nr:flavonoid synthase I [Plagiochasma appendiculatum]